MYDLSITRRPVSSVKAIQDPHVGDVYKYGTRYMVVIQKVTSYVTVMFFDRAIIDTPYQNVSLRTFSSRELELRFMDPDDSGKSMLSLVSRSLIEITEEWLCAGCPIGIAKMQKVAKRAHDRMLNKAENREQQIRQEMILRQPLSEKVGRLASKGKPQKAGSDEPTLRDLETLLSTRDPPFE